MTCPLCDGQLAERATVRLASGAIHQCLGCGSGIVWPRPDEARLIAQHDNDDYFSHPYFEAHRHADESPLYEARLALIQPALVDRSRTLLDVGCDTGAFIALVAQRAQVRTIGVDVSQRAAKEAKREGRDVRAGTLESQQFPACSFGVVTAFDVVEHVAEPVALLREVRRVLIPEGRFVAEVPHFDGLVYRLGRILGRLGMLSGPMSAVRDRLWPSFHVQYPTRQGVNAALQRAGLEVVAIGGREFDPSELALDRGLLRALVLIVFRVARWMSAPTVLVISARPQ